MGKYDNVKASEFGIPSKKKYPLDTKAHVKSAIKFFNYVDKEDEAILAANIKKAAKKHGIIIRCGKKNRLSKYITKEYIDEVMEHMTAAGYSAGMVGVVNGTVKQHIAQGDIEYHRSDEYPYSKKKKRKKKDNSPRTVTNKPDTSGLSETEESDDVFLF